MNCVSNYVNNVQWLANRKKDDRFNKQNKRHIQATSDLMKNLSLESELNVSIISKTSLSTEIRVSN